ncbi:hypothetical protein S40285_09496 [Stachybotrys chlorohalonatus IBT 40285]|uniref:Uncharacterized protein n=1 Tax=Stachybotrys chlorohalonatus (strain IBT 40285) TaxID=1283841 RepID=A0A084QWW0_STAC4|nr:hypothetical protein S40285_09496 [Stachybotrys chlorohalonata IBT 40285]
MDVSGLYPVFPDSEY